jgi:hypothetical protein
VDDPAAHHLRIRDRAVRRRSRRFLPADHRRDPPERPGRPPCAPRGDGRRPGFHGHARPGGGRLGVAQLEVPEGGPCGGHDLCPLDPHPEAGAGRWLAHSDSRLAGGRAHGRWGSMRRGRGRSQCAARPPGPRSRTCFKGAGPRTGGSSSLCRGHPAAGAATAAHAGWRCDQAHSGGRRGGCRSGPADRGGFRWAGANGKRQASAASTPRELCGGPKWRYPWSRGSDRLPRPDGSACRERTSYRKPADAGDQAIAAVGAACSRPVRGRGG